MDAEEAGIVSFGRLVQNLQGRESPVAFNDCVSPPALLDDDQRLVPEEAVVQVGLRELFQCPLLEQETENLRLRCPFESFREPRVLVVEKQPFEGNPLNHLFPRVDFIHSQCSFAGRDEKMVKAASTKSGLAGRFDLQTAVNQLLDSCTDFLRSILQHHLNPGADAGARVFAYRVVPVAAGPADVTLKLAVDPTNWSELDSSDIAVFPGFSNNAAPPSAPARPVPRDRTGGEDGIQDGRKPVRRTPSRQSVGAPGPRAPTVTDTISSPSAGAADRSGRRSLPESVRWMGTPIGSCRRTRICWT